MTERDSIREFCRPRDEPCDWSRQNGVCSHPDIGVEDQVGRVARGLCHGASQKFAIGKMTASGFEPYAVCTTKAAEEFTEPETSGAEKGEWKVYYTIQEEGADGRTRDRKIGFSVPEEEFREFHASKAKSESLISSSSSPDHRT